MSEMHGTPSGNGSAHHIADDYDTADRVIFEAVHAAVLNSFAGRITTNAIYLALRGGVMDAMLHAMRDPALSGLVRRALRDGAEAAHLKIAGNGGTAPCAAGGTAEATAGPGGTTQGVQAGSGDRGHLNPPEGSDAAQGTPRADEGTDLDEGQPVECADCATATAEGLLCGAADAGPVDGAPAAGPAPGKAEGALTGEIEPDGETGEEPDALEMPPPMRFAARRQREIL